jgi:hypothetical protein
MPASEDAAAFTTSAQIPSDFPQVAPAGAVPGAQPKLLAREEGGRFVICPGEGAVRARHAVCEDLAHQLSAYSARKRSEDPERSKEQLGVQVALAVRKRAFAWGLSPAETEWVLRRLDALAAAEPKEQL